MSEELHDVVKLMLARMDSHPQEFISPAPEEEYVQAVEFNRWWRAMNEIQEYGSEEEKKAIATKLRGLRLQRAHEWTMDELCNGDERRRKEKMARELEEQRYRASQVSVNKAYMNTLGSQSYDYNMQQAMSQLNAIGNYSMSTDLEKDAIVIRNHDTNLNVAIDRNGLYDTKSPLDTIKKALGLK